MGQAKIKRNRQRAEAEKRQADTLSQPAISIPPPSKPVITIKIDYDEVPIEKRSDPRFIGLLNYMQRRLSNPNEITAICIHEAAHALFLQIAGMQNFTFSGPQITYDQATNTFDYTGASVKGTDWNTGYLTTINAGQWVTAAALAYVGAGIAVEELTSRTDNGDFGDRKNFNKAFEMLRNKHPELFPSDFNLDAFWLKAGKRAKEYLQRPNIRQAILNTAAKIRDPLF